MASDDEDIGGDSTIQAAADVDGREPSPTSPVARKRAKKACLSCRARKVRCDVSHRGTPPCMNCFLDKVKCVVVDRASKYRPRKPRKENTAHTAQATSRSGCDVEAKATDDDLSPEDGNERDGPGDVAQQPSHIHADPLMPHDQASSSTTTSPTIADGNGDIELGPGANRDASNDFATRLLLSQGDDFLPLEPEFPNLEIPAYDSPAFAQSSTEPRSSVVFSYYPFLCLDNLHNLSPEDVSYLELQSCLHVPARPILDEFMQKYFLHVSPLLPMLDEGDVWDMYYNATVEGPQRGMSLLVLQALLFSTCCFVSTEAIKALGFPDARSARSGLYRRARLLYDFDGETSPVSISQAALLLSLWATNPARGPKKRNSRWLSIAIQNAKMAEAHHYDDLVEDPPFGTRNALKRLWWCCVIRDRILPLCCRRSIQITRADFDFAAHTPLRYEDLAGEVQRSMVYDPDTKRRLIRILVLMAQLCIVLTDVLYTAYPPDDAPCHGRWVPTEEMRKIRECKLGFQRWYKQASENSALQGLGQTSRTNHQDQSMILHHNLLFMYYHTARVALCHHEILLLTSFSPAMNPGTMDAFATYPSSDLMKIRQDLHELQDAVSAVTECLGQLMSLGLVRWLPISAVACTALPLVLHVLDAKLSSGSGHGNTSSSSPMRIESNGHTAAQQRRLRTVVQAMETYHGRYDAVDHVGKTMRYIVDLAQLNKPQSEALIAFRRRDPSESRRVKIDWTDLLTKHPTCYLRLVLTMDLSLNKDRLPAEADFPPSLRGLFSEGPGPVQRLLDFEERLQATLSIPRPWSDGARQLTPPGAGAVAVAAGGPPVSIPVRGEATTGAVGTVVGAAPTEEVEVDGVNFDLNSTPDVTALVNEMAEEEDQGTEVARLFGLGPYFGGGGGGGGATGGGGAGGVGMDGTATVAEPGVGLVSSGGEGIPPELLAPWTNWE